MRQRIKIKKCYESDVLVIGAGIAGLSAAISASENNSSVTLVSTGEIFSGSSFYPGTWGLGLIGPMDKTDQSDLIQTIKRVGCGVVDEKLVQTFVEQITASIARVQDMGVVLKQSKARHETQFIPCFDHKHRQWNGILFESVKEVFTRILAERQVQLRPQTTVLKIIKNKKNQVVGALLSHNESLEYHECKSLVIASGGCGGLYEYRLNTEDIISTGQALALQAGATLCNLEFMQVMPGYITPAYKTIYNEKVFKYLTPKKPLFNQLPDTTSLLDMRSTHGPFTTRLPSKVIDLALFNEFKVTRGVDVSYDNRIKDDHSEFVNTYFEWLKKEKQLGVDDPFKLGYFFHASNGGIYINSQGETDVAGLYACGEVTGGMHGADRLGGLSTANGLVFGFIAGQSAANFAKVQQFDQQAFVELELSRYENPAAVIKTLQSIMFEHTLLIKSDESLRQALSEIKNLIKTLQYSEAGDINLSAQLDANIMLAKAVIYAMRLRCESRGSHYRSDYPVVDDQFEKLILVKEGMLHASY